MKTILITGSNGTIGTELKKYFLKKKYNVVCWNREEVPIDNYHKMFDFIKGKNIDIIYHLAAITDFNYPYREERWEVNYNWPSELAWISKKLNVDFVYISSALVFAQDQIGPYTVETNPNENHGYGFEKRKSEEKVFSQNKNAKIVRIGWQIDNKIGNTMVSNLDSEMKSKGVIYANTNWLPSCSFLSDTIECLYELIDLKSGLYMINSNIRWNFFEVISALNKYYNKDWKIIPIDDFQWDQRMIDEKVQIPSLENKLNL